MPAFDRHAERQQLNLKSSELPKAQSPGGPPINQETEKRIDRLFTPEDREVARTLLRDECGANLFPRRENPPESEIERIRFAVLNLSKGEIDTLKKAVEQAKTDWRDVLVWAGFENDPEKHRSWLPPS